MGARRGVVCELHDWSADSEFTELLKGRYITDIVDDEILVLDNGMWLHVETEDEGFKGGTFIQYLNVCGRNDARIMSAHLVDDYGEDPISLIERQTYTLFVMVNDMERPVLKIVREDAPYYCIWFSVPRAAKGADCKSATVNDTPQVRVLSGPLINRKRLHEMIVEAFPVFSVHPRAVGSRM